MGAGTYPAGIGFAGADPVIGASREERPLSNALYVAGETLDYELDENGRHREVHPIDATVFMRMRAAKQWIKSSSKTGNSLRGITHIDRSTIERQARDIIQREVQDLVDRGDIAIDSIPIELPVRGRILAALVYVNLRSPNDKRPKRVEAF